MDETRKLADHKDFLVRVMGKTPAEADKLVAQGQEAVDNKEKATARLQGTTPSAPQRKKGKGKVVGLPPRFTENAPEQVQAAWDMDITRSRLGEYLTTGPVGWPGAILHGGLGRGKTGFAALALFMTAEYHAVGRFILLYDLVNMVKETWNDNPAFTERDIVKQFVAPALLVVDDVGVQFQTHAERNILYAVLVGRHNYLKPTILTTNCDLNTDDGREEFYESVGRRVADRFQGCLLDANSWGGNLR